MPDRTDVIYSYDGCFEGLLCCVFESYEKKEIPLDIIVSDTAQTTFLPVRDICTDPEKARRVLVSIPRKIGAETLDFIQRAFLTCLPHKELEILRFLRLGYRFGPAVRIMLTNDTVNTLTGAVRHLENESHLLKGFIRFSVSQGALVAEIEPKNLVLPLLSRHFCERYPEESFLIYDKTHGMALAYRPHRAEILSVESLELPEPDSEELYFRGLWQLFYRTVEVEGRHNPKCRMGHMPKRYWKYLTEFGAAHRIVPEEAAKDQEPQRQKAEPPYLPSVIK